MKNLLRFLGIIAFVAVIGFVAACSNGSTGGPGSNTPRPVVPLKETYVSYDGEGNEYELVITETVTGRAAYDPKSGDTYTLTITFVNGINDGKKATSTGTVAITIDEETNAVSIELKHKDTGTTITVAVSGGGGAFTCDSGSGKIPVDNDSEVKDVPIVDLPYSLSEDGKGWIITSGESFIKDGGAADIPAFPPFDNSKPVTAIGIRAFFNNKNLTTVTFAPNSQLKTIGGEAFKNCISLLSVIEIPASVTSLEFWGSFDGCENLTTVTFAPNSQLKTIGGGAFINCKSLSVIEIPASVTYIGDCAFQGCESLTAITIPAGVTSLGSTDDRWLGVFLFCKKLKTVTFAPGSQLKILGAGTFEGCTSLESITIPAGVTHIGGNSFFNTGLTSITIPASVTRIEWFTFEGCKNLKSVTFESGSKLEDIGGRAFRDCTSLTNITIPASVTKIGIQTFDGCTSLKTVTFAQGSQLKYIGSIEEEWSLTFVNCTSLESITIPASVTEIGGLTFKGCTGFTSITIPSSVTIGRGAFSDWTSSQTINIQGYANQQSADAAWQNWYDPETGELWIWRTGCNAVIKYWNGSSYQ